MSFRFALEKYIKSPESFPDLVIEYDDDFVLLRDAFPKSLYHWLLLPRDRYITKKHPLTAFSDPLLKSQTQERIDRATSRILELLKTDHGIDEGSSYVRAGCHSVPSLNNLHIHIISQDFNGDGLKNRHHYNSFTTEFFVPFDDLPLDKGDTRLNAEVMEKKAKTDDLICHNCGKNFGNKFAELKRHIHQEFKERFGK
ncbi:Aprataxin-like protein [Cyberlindnera fabianii]|uniref:Aprataxin-like protein n=1 Tax=Cyberlindnera fabianii TaxID=36022 RepID=A0A1V2L4A2_CYBFA|nr:Aprataxin-like protein [Cyberlindnera fabianii]